MHDVLERRSEQMQPLRHLLQRSLVHGGGMGGVCGCLTTALREIGITI